MPKLRKITYLSNNFYMDPKTIVDLRDHCSNPMAGQVITLAGTPVQPVIHLPNTVGNKGLSGFAANLFFLFAQYFKFKPRIKFTGGGTFIPYNRTFTPGAFNDVCLFEIFEWYTTVD